MRQLTQKQRADVVVWYLKRRSFKDARRRYRRVHRSRPPSKRTIWKWVQRFGAVGSVANKKHVFASTPEKEQLAYGIMGAFEADPHLSTKRAASLFGVSDYTVRRILRRHNLHAYKVHVLHELKPEDYERRLDFCREEILRIAANPSHLDFLLFSDEAVFHLDGKVNAQNCRYWSNGNPHWTMEKSQYFPKVTVWCGIWREGVVGPFFFDESVTGRSYLRMLKEEFLPELEALHMQRQVCVFMQDGAPPHWWTSVRKWLSDTFPGRWMGRGSPSMPWPPRSPDLTICDFFVWGFIKSQVYTGRISTLDILKQRIEAAFLLITDEMRAAAFAEYEARLGRCTWQLGGHVEAEP